MSSLKTAIAVAAIASLCTNLYLIRKAYNGEGRPEIHVSRIDEPVVIRAEGGRLEVTTLWSREEFTSTTDHKILGIPIGKTISRIRVPAVFRYHIELAPEWKVELRGSTFLVVAPAVKPSLPVAFDTARIEKESSGLWSPFTGGAELEQLQRSITKTLADTAIRSSYVERQREEARKSVKEFVAKWLITQERWKDAAKYPIQVYFDDEPIRALRGAPPPFVSSM